MLGISRFVLSGAVLLVAVAVVAYKYWDYVINPWTRNGVVRAQVIQITPRVSGQIVKLPIKDNQLVRQGDLLFEIDPRTFKASLDQAHANLDKMRDDIKALNEQVKGARAAIAQQDALMQQANSEIAGYESNFERARLDFERAEELLPKGTIARKIYDDRKAAKDIAADKLSRAKARLVEVISSKAQAEAALARAIANLGAPGEGNAQVRAATAALEIAKLNLEFTQVKAPASGYVTNLQLRVGDQAIANQPALALIDIDSFYVHGLFRETAVGKIVPGDRAIITLMSYPDRSVEGRVDSVGWGIAQKDGSPGYQLLPSISPTFEWIRLAQRVPVRIRLKDVPDAVQLRVGSTASVLVMTGTGGNSADTVPPLPRALQ